MAQDPRRQGLSRPVFNDDYVARLPEDPYGQETAPNARIWRVYVEEAAAFDENMVGQSRDGLDVMLVFVRIVLELCLKPTHLLALLGRSLLCRGHIVPCPGFAEPSGRLFGNVCSPTPRSSHRPALHG